jgi:hypothetical protein
VSLARLTVASLKKKNNLTFNVLNFIKFWEIIDLKQNTLFKSCWFVALA